MTVAVMTNKEWAALTRALDRPEWLEDRRFGTPALRDQNIDQRLAMTQDVLRSRTTEEWLTRLEAEGVPCAPVLTREQVIAHPQVLASGILMESDHAAVGRIRQTRAAARFSETPTTLRFGAPRLGEHNAEILASWASSAVTSSPCRAAASLAARRRRRIGGRADAPRGAGGRLGRT
jgi:crotonobetainyl-CoA:carnitine CoA-transferase CaiB-like acyl-CoA transferase